MKRLALAALLLLPLTLSAKDCPPGWEKHPEKHPECAGVVLPVTVTSFKAVKRGNIALLKWTVAMEVNHSHYEIGRSSNGVDFTTIGTTREHSFEDVNPDSINYYRLVSVDLDGTKHYYRMVYLRLVVPAFEVFDAYGQYLGVYKYQDLPKGRMLVIDKRKVYLN